jgi:hypothetical protein
MIEERGIPHIPRFGTNSRGGDRKIKALLVVCKIQVWMTLCQTRPHCFDFQPSWIWLVFSRMLDTLNVTLFNDISSIDILNICIIIDIVYSIAIDI